MNVVRYRNVFFQVLNGVCLLHCVSGGDVGDKASIVLQAAAREGKGCHLLCPVFLPHPHCYPCCWCWTYMLVVYICVLFLDECYFQFVYNLFA